MPKRVYTDTPVIVGNEVIIPMAGAERRILVGSSEWFTWLETAPRFSIQVILYQPIRRTITVTMRASKRKRGGRYWSAFGKDGNGRLHNVYVGMAEKLTFERIRSAATGVAEKVIAEHLIDEREQFAKFKYENDQARMKSHGEIKTVKAYVPKKREERRPPPVGKGTAFAILTVADVARFRELNDLLGECTHQFRLRWGREWLWSGGRIERHALDRQYYVISYTGYSRRAVGSQRHEVVRKLLEWVNQNFDER